MAVSSKRRTFIALANIGKSKEAYPILYLEHQSGGLEASAELGVLFHFGGSSLLLRDHGVPVEICGALLKPRCDP